MPGRNPREAVDDFLEPLKDSLSCIAHVKITLSRGGWSQRGRTHALTVNDDQPVAMRFPAGKPRLLLRVGMHYEIVPNETAGQEPLRIRTRAYDYELQLASGEAVVSYHWHPDSRITAPHLHVGRTQLAADAVLSHKAHQPTDRISLESVVRACITEFGAQPLKEDWERVLALREGQFKLFRHWS